MNQFYFDAIYATYPNAVTINSDSIVYDSDNNVININEDVVSNKILELEALEPMRLLRIERNRRLVETDWRFRSDLTPSQAWIDYCQALRDLPANSEPQLDENGNLTNVGWPEVPE